MNIRPHTFITLTLLSAFLCAPNLWAQSSDVGADEGWHELGSYEYVEPKTDGAQTIVSKTAPSRTPADTDGWRELETFKPVDTPSAPSHAPAPSHINEDGWHALESYEPVEADVPSPAIPATPSPDTTTHWTDIEDGISSMVALPAASPYLASGDVIEILVANADSLSGEYTVSDIGTITMPLIGNIMAKGLSADTLSRSLEQIYGADYLQNPTIIVTPKTAPLGEISLHGLVNAPRAFPVTSIISLAEALSKGAGLSRPAETLDAVILRQVGDGVRARRVALDGIKLGDNPGPTLLPGDHVSIIERRHMPEINTTAHDYPLLQNVLRGGAPSKF